MCSAACRRVSFERNYAARVGVSYQQKHQDWYRRRYNKPLITNKAKPLDPKRRVSLHKGVHRNKHDNVWVALLTLDGKCYQKTFSIKKLGDRSAKLCASMQRLIWLIDLGIWSPDKGDPFKLLSFMDTFEGNEDIRIQDVESPWAAPDETYA